jgi:hypothetical protein
MPIKAIRHLASLHSYLIQVIDDLIVLTPEDVATFPTIAPATLSTIKQYMLDSYDTFIDVVRRNRELTLECDELRKRATTAETHLANIRAALLAAANA